MTKPTPNFLLIGATKAGTESIYAYFNRNIKEVALFDKQVHYFCRGLFGPNYNGLEQETASYEEYLRHAPLKKRALKTGDFDCVTLHGAEAPELLVKANPNAKVMIILRNPIERAYSHYWMDVRECFETRPFADAVRLDYEKLSGGSREYCPLIRLGYYAQQIRGFREALGAERVKIWLYDDFCKTPQKVLAEMCEFVGVNYVPPSETGEIRENVASIPKSRLSAALLRARRNWLKPFRHYYIKLPRSIRRYIKNTFLVKKIKVPAMPTEARQLLSTIYKDDILEIEKMLGCDLAHWLRDPENPMALPVEFQDQQKLKQAKFFDEATDEEFEIERPHGCGPLYEWSIRSKFERAANLLSFPIRGATLLDICCGSGMAAEIYSGYSAIVQGMDISDRSVARARERARRHGFSAEFTAGDAEKLPFPDGSFDIVAVHDGLHHLPNPHAAIAEMVRVARKAIIVIEPARSWLTRRAVNLRLALDYEDAGNYVYRLREDEVFEIAKKQGFGKCAYQQYLLYYRHEPFKVAKSFERKLLLPAVSLTFDAMSHLVPRLGNKICIVCERS